MFSQHSVRWSPLPVRDGLRGAPRVVDFKVTPVNCAQRLGASPVPALVGGRMNVDYLVIADAAATADGKHYIHGAGWDTLFAASFPVTHPSLAVAVRLRVPWNDTNQPHRIELDVLDEDGVSILGVPPGPPGGEINLGRPPNLGQGEDQVICLTFNLNNLSFQQTGTYAVVFRLDGTDQSRSPFRVKPVPGGRNP